MLIPSVCGRLLDVQNAPNAKSALWSTLALQEFPTRTLSHVYHVFDDSEAPEWHLGHFGRSGAVPVAVALRSADGRTRGELAAGIGPP